MSFSPMYSGLMPGEWDALQEAMRRTGGPLGLPTPNPAGAIRGGILGTLDERLKPFGGLLGVGANLLSQSGQTSSFGGALGNALLQGQQRTSESEQDKLRSEFMQAQIEAMRAPKRGTPQIIMGPDGKPVYSSDVEGKTPYIEPKSNAQGLQYVGPGGALVDATGKPVFRNPSVRSGPDAPSGYRWTRDGALEPVPGGPAAPDALPNVRRTREQTTSLRKEFEGLDPVKNYRAAITNFQRAATAPNTRAGDLSIVYALGKIFDPASVVREGELQLSKDAQPWLAKMVNEAQSQVTGRGALDPTTRRNMLDAMKGQVDAMQQSYTQEAERYAGYATQYEIDPQQVIGSDPLDAFRRPPGAPGNRPPPARPGQAPKGERSIKRTGTVNGRRVVEYSDGTIEYAQ